MSKALLQMKTLITHINPHLDDIAAIWLFKKFHPEFAKSKIEFISQSQTDKIKGSETVDRIFFGIGKGRFDEHKGQTDECAATLVWKEIKISGLAPKNEYEIKAYDEFTHWVYLDDTAKLPFDEFGIYKLNSFIRSYENDPKDSLKTVELGCEILERIIPMLIKKQYGLAEWEKRIEFKSKWGRSVAVEGTDFSRNWAYSKGFNLVVQLSPIDRFLGITAPGTSDIDLTPIYTKLIRREPGIPWFLHHGKKMILCGAASAPDVKKSRLNLKQVIDIVKLI